MSKAKKLNKFVDALQTDIDKENTKKQKRKNQERERRAYNKLPTYSQRTAFWCDRCNIDFVAPAYKVWSDAHQHGNWQSFCPVCGDWVFRYITAKKLDPYYLRSEKIQVMRGESAKDLIQPGNYGFRTLYGDPFERYYKRFQEQHEALHNKYASMGLVGKTLKQKSEEEILREEMRI